MDSLSGLIKNKYTKKSAISKQMQASMILDKANAFIQEKWGRSFEARAVSFKNKTLKINCQNPVIAQEVKFSLIKIKQALNEKLGSDTVRKVMIVQNSIDKSNY